MKILIQDGDSNGRDLLEETLRDAGHEPVIAADSVEALDILRRGDCSLVISEWLPAGTDGLELCRRIRAAHLPKFVYVIILSTQHGTPAMLEAIQAGADEFISKPFDADALIGRIMAIERLLTTDTQDVTIFALAKLAESRDPETGAHVDRVREYCKLIASQLYRTKNMPCPKSEFVRLIGLTSTLHDIGKVGIPDAVLLKPTRLTGAEFELMKTHARIGGDTLGAALREFPNSSFLRMARNIALTHHERYDGAGYPDRLAGNQIPLSGRVVALADVYDALTSKRVYKESMPHAEAAKIIRSERGKQFDPVLMDVFEANEAEFERIQEQFNDAAQQEGLAVGPVAEPC